MVYKVIFTNNELFECFRFAKGMIGNHNPNIISNRDDREIFRDDIRGKLGEMAVRKYFIKEMPEAKITGELDFDVYGRGTWDNYDLIIDNKNISVKSIKPQSTVLMIECKRFEFDGKYAYKNNDGSEIEIDYYVLVRVGIEPDINWSDIRAKDINDFLNPPSLVYENGKWVTKGKKIRRFNAEILGRISHKEFWDRKKFMQTGMKLTVRNLNALLLKGCNIDNLPDKRTSTDGKNNILQVDNYAVHKDILRSLDELKI